MTVADNKDSLGAQRVRIDFNPTKNNDVHVIKSMTGALINLCSELNKKGDKESAEKRRLIALANTAYEEAAMWAVKAATF
jgi:hypothetical protein